MNGRVKLLKYDSFQWILNKVFFENLCAQTCLGISQQSSDCSFLLSQPATLPVKLVLVQVTRTAKTVKKAGLKMKKQLVWVSNARFETGFAATLANDIRWHHIKFYSILWKCFVSLDFYSLSSWLVLHCRKAEFPSHWLPDDYSCLYQTVHCVSF